VKLRLNPSGLRRWFRCKYEWYAHAVLGIRSAQRLPSPHRDRGKAFHALLEFAWRHYAKTGKVFNFAGQEGYDYAEAIFERVYQDDGTVIDEATCYELLEAIRWHVPRLKMHEWEVLLIEAGLRAPLIEGVELQAIVDIVLRHKTTGKVWLVDWKTTEASISTTADFPYLRNNYQLLICRTVLAHHGIKVDNSALVRLRSRAPTPPEITPSRKKVSVNKAKLACDWETFRQALIDNDEDPNSESAQAVRMHLAETTFERWYVDVTDARTAETLRKDLQRIAGDMLALQAGDKAPTRTLLQAPPRSGCNRCDTKLWCFEELKLGQHPKSLLGVYYSTTDGSPFAGQESQLTVVPDPHHAYITWAAQNGRDIAATEEFRP